MSQPDPERTAPPIFAQNEHWLDKAIADARKDGAFDNLPNTGKPLKLDEVSVDSEWDLAFTMLKNAGAAPFWMEMQKDGDAIQERMNVLAARTRAFLADNIATSHVEPAPVSAPIGKRSLWDRIFGRAAGESAAMQVRFDRGDLIRARDKARADYLEIADELDAHLVKYHQSLPSNLWHLQRYRKSREEYAADFDTAVPEIDDLLNGKALDEAAIDG